MTKNDTATSVRKFKEGLIVMCERKNKRKAIVQTVHIRRNYDAELVLGKQPICIYFFSFPGSCLQREQCAHASSRGGIDGLTDWPLIPVCKAGWKQAYLWAGTAAGSPHAAAVAQRAVIDSEHIVRIKGETWHRLHHIVFPYVNVCFKLAASKFLRLQESVGLVLPEKAWSP